MTQDIEKYAQAIIDVGAEVDSHIDGDARIQTFTFNEAQVIAFAELVAEEGAKAERERCKARIDKMQDTSRGKQDTPFGHGYHTALVDAYNCLQ